MGSRDEWCENEVETASTVDPSADSVTKDAGGAFVNKCIINLLCFRKKPAILTITAVTTPPNPFQQLSVPFKIHNASEASAQMTQRYTREKIPQ